MADSKLDAALREADLELKKVEIEFGPNDSRLADCLEAYGHLLKEKKIRLLDAANMLARARVIRENSKATRGTTGGAPCLSDGNSISSEHYQENGGETFTSAEPVRTDRARPSNVDTKDCPFCAETIKFAAIKCKHCGSDLPNVEKFNNATNRDVAEEQHLNIAAENNDQLLAKLNTAVKNWENLDTSAAPLQSTSKTSNAIATDEHHELLILPVILLGLVPGGLILWWQSQPGANIGDLIIALVFGLIGLIVYFIPACIGSRKSNAGAIFILNLFLGWTFLGWVIALVWACTTERTVGDRKQ